MALDLVLVTGMSGAGKSTALKMLEDSGFFCVDNLPISLIGTFVLMTSEGKEGKRSHVAAPFRRSTRSRSASISAAGKN